MAFADATKAFLDHMRAKGDIEAWFLERRKLGLCSAPIGEWHVVIETRDLAQLDAAFNSVTPRAGDEERLHAAVWSKVTNLHFGLYRDFPDANREP